ncbi:sulfatase [Marinilabilia rubra]|nr:sulfatase [Marinilabilia rubra]
MMNLLKLKILLLGCIILLVDIQMVGQNGEKPNVVFIIADDLMKQTELYGYPEIKTPRLSKLADEAVLFNRAYCQYPLCGPSRAVIQASLYPSKTGITWNKPGKDEATQTKAASFNVKTMPHYFRDNGYTTVGGGKIYHNTTVGGKPGAIYDFDDVLSNAGVDGVKGTMPDGKKVTYITDNSTRTITEHRDGALIENAKAWLDTYDAASNNPFFMCLGIKKPHSPFSAPSQFWDMYNRDEIKVSDILLPEGVNADLSLNGIDGLFSGHVDTYMYTGENIPVDKQKEIIHGYSACVSFADYLVGDIIDKLKAKNLYDNTIIVFVSDHGYKLGEYQRWAKSTVHEKDAVVPLLIRDPRKTSEHGKISQAIVGLIDIYPTLSELCGIPLPENIDGISFADVLFNTSVSGRTHISTIRVRSLSEIGIERAISLSIINPDGYRYTQHWGGEYDVFPMKEDIIAYELYDHYKYRNTPISVENLVNTETELLEEMRQLVLSSSEEITGSATSVKNVELKDLNYYYNRSTEKIHISSSDLIEQVAIYDIVGYKVIDLEKNTNKLEIDLSGLKKNNVFLARISAKGKTSVIKVLK